MNGARGDLRAEWEERSEREGLLRVMRKTHSHDAAAAATVQTLAAISESTRLVKGLSGIPAGGHAIELGCGIGRVSAMIAGHFDSLLCVDFSKRMLALASVNLSGLSNVQLAYSDVTEFLETRADKEFDAGYSVWVLMHILDDDVLARTLSQVARTCRFFVFMEYTTAQLAVSAVSQIRPMEVYLKYLGDPPLIHRSEVTYEGDVSAVVAVDLRSVC